MTSSTSESRIASCCHCGAARQVKATAKGHPRTPRGWHNISGTVTCADCWHKTYRIAAVTIPVSHAEWETLRPALRQAQKDITQLSNWAVRRLIANDVVRGPGMEKLPPMPAIYLYGEAAECDAWERLSKGTGGAVLQAVEQRYRRVRYDLIWRSAASPPLYRYPQPVPLRPDGFAIAIEDERIVVRALVGGQRHPLTLAGGHQFRRQRKAVEWLIAHPELRAQAALIEIEASSGDHRPEDVQRANGNGPIKRRKLLLKLVGWLPIKSDVIADNSLIVRSDSESLLVAHDTDNKRVWTYHADHARRIANRHSEHLSRLARLSDDRKAERRKPKRDCKPYVAMLGDRARKDNARLTSLCHEISASLISYARRCRAAEIVYDDTDTSFAPSFPWSKMRALMEQKGRASGITVRRASTAVPAETPEALAPEQEQ